MNLNGKLIKSLNLKTKLFNNNSNNNINHNNKKIFHKKTIMKT